LRKAIITGERRAELVEAPDLKPQGEWAVVKVHAAPMCTEYKAFLNGGRAEFLGHEAAGEVVAVAQPGRVRVGDRMVAMPLYGCGKCQLCIEGDYIHCQNQPDYAALHGSLEGTSTYAQYLLKQDWLLLPIPDDVSYEKAALACCALGPSFGAYDIMGVDRFSSVLITGAGPVGLGAVANAKFRGAKSFVVESHPYRVERAKELGADAVIDPMSGNAAQQILELTGGRGVDCSLDCSGVPAAQRVCIDATRRKGKVAFVGECYDDELKIRVSPDMIRKGLTLVGSWHYNLALYAGVMQVIRESPVVDKLVSHVLPLSDVQGAMELSASRNCAKMILQPWA
jgi:L-iditol 2-dehydrogenase